MSTSSIVIWASGSGSNAENLIQQLHPHRVFVKAIYCNNAKAGVIERGKRLGVPVRMIENADLKEASKVDEFLELDQPDLIVLAGFLRKFPSRLLNRFKAMNLHPALLPSYGGKGMYGMHVHRAVIESGGAESGITIHYVNENYDEGAAIKQVKVSIAPTDTPESLAQKIHKLEHEHYPTTIEKLLISD